MAPLNGALGERRRLENRDSDGTEWGKVWGGVSLPNRLGGLGERRELPQRGPRQIPGRKRIVAYSEGRRTFLFTRMPML